MAYRTCAFPVCGKGVSNAGLCAGHYRQKWLGKELTPLRPRGRSAGLLCTLSGCDDPMDSTGLCTCHYAQKTKTPLSTEEFILGFKRQDGCCPYCTEALGARFQLDHHHGPCHGSHPASTRMCRLCIRGMIHRECNEELKWLERAIAGGRAGTLSDHVIQYLAARPFGC